MIAAFCVQNKLVPWGLTLMSRLISSLVMQAEVLPDSTKSIVSLFTVGQIDWLLETLIDTFQGNNGSMILAVWSCDMRLGWWVVESNEWLICNDYVYMAFMFDTYIHTLSTDYTRGPTINVWLTPAHDDCSSNSDAHAPSAPIGGGLIVGISFEWNRHVNEYLHTHVSTLA